MGCPDLVLWLCLLRSASCDDQRPVTNCTVISDLLLLEKFRLCPGNLVIILNNGTIGIIKLLPEDLIDKLNVLNSVATHLLVEIIEQAVFQAYTRHHDAIGAYAT